METNKALIYIAGHSDLYPMEYYNYNTNKIEGAIPAFLQKFSQESQYEVVYFGSSTVDLRDQLADQLQVDLVTQSGVRSEEEPFTTNEVLLFQGTVEGVTIDYWISLTQTAPAGLANDLRLFVAGTSQAQQVGLFTEALYMPMTQKVQRMTVGLVGLALAVVLLLIWSVALFFKFRNQKVKELLQRQTDLLTGVGNMEYLQQRYEQDLQGNTRILYSLFYFFIDGSRIEHIGGREALQELHRYISDVLRKSLNSEDIIAKVNDQSFAVLRITGDRTELEMWLQGVLKQIFEYTGLSCSIDACNIAIGVYPLTTLRQPLGDLLGFAGRSAEMAFDAGKEYRYCDKELERSIVVERELQSEVARGIQDKEFELYVQFYINVQSGRIAGAEALTRWEHPTKGFLLPDRFIPFMEKGGYIDQMDYLIFEKACLFLSEVHAQGLDKFFLSCNFSRKTFVAPDFVDRSLKIIEQYSFPRENLIFEMTESSSVTNFTSMLKNAQRLKAEGFRIALDDFGEKEASLFDLQEYPIDIIKLDKRLIDNIQTQKGRAILKGVIQIGHDLGLKIFAEGVEEDLQVEILREINCDIIQGFHFHYPIPSWSAKNKLLS